MYPKSVQVCYLSNYSLFSLLSVCVTRRVKWTNIINNIGYLLQPSNKSGPGHLCAAYTGKSICIVFDRSLPYLYIHISLITESPSGICIYNLGFIIRSTRWHFIYAVLECLALWSKQKWRNWCLMTFYVKCFFLIDFRIICFSLPTPKSWKLWSKHIYWMTVVVTFIDDVSITI